jgi:putative PIN family toxin of toxin-antitoxin system
VPILPFRVVLDTNILVRGLINRRCDSGRILLACEERRVVALLSRELIAEYRLVLTEQKLVERYPELQPAKIKTAIERLMYIGEIGATHQVRFDFARDRKDEKLIILAIAGQATHLVTTDNDLLELPSSRGDAATRLRRRRRNLEVMTPEQFVLLFGPELRIERV